MTAYWAYENSKNNGYRVRIHTADCIYCKFRDQTGPVVLGTGRVWHGPFDDLASATDFAKNTGAKVEQCKLCLKNK